MEENSYSINIKDLTSFEHICFPDSFEEYSEAVGFLLRRKNIFILEDDILAAFKDDPDIQKEMERGNQGMGAIKAFFPNRFVRETIHPKEGGEEDEGVWGWLDLWSDYIISEQEEMYDFFFTYKLRQTDLLELDNILNYYLEKYESDNKTDFIRFLKLTLRKHGKRLLQPEQIETVNEWMAEREKEATLSGAVEPKTKGKPKRQRDDKVTLLNQEQTALLIYCLRETKVIFPDEFLNNKEAGLAFSILTGYSADTIRQNLNKSELSKTATSKNVEAVEKALKEVLKYIERDIKPED
jgi:hypothetical protein